MSTDGIQGRRVRVGRGYESIRREAIQDPRLSFKATGILAFLLSLPDAWRTNAERLSGVKNKLGKAKEGRESMQAGLRELEEAGYLIRRKYQDSRGTWRWDWRYSDNPADLHVQDVSAGQTGDGLPVDGSAEFGSPVDGSPVDIEVSDVEVLQRDLEEQEPQDLVTAGAVTDDDAAQVDLFGEPVSSSESGVSGSQARSKAELDELWWEFWGVYPLKKAKIAARKAWDAAVRNADPREIINAAIRYAQELEASRRQAFTKHPATWLNGGCWDDDPEPTGPPGTNGNGHTPYQQTATDEDYIRGVETRSIFQ